jgi:hypothetical protein
MFATTRIAIASGSLLLIALAAQAGVRAQMEVQGDDVENTILLDHPFLNNNPDALIVVSQVGWEVPSAIHVYYSVVWRLSNISAAPIPSSATFWIFMFDQDSGFRHTTTAGNLVSNYTILDDPRLNGNPSARPIVTRESTSGHPTIPWPIGVWYNSGISRWTIFYQDTTKVFLENASFSVFIPSGQDWAFTHTATIGNINSNYTVLDNPDIDQSEPHRIFISQRWESIYNDANIGIGWLFSYLIGNVGNEPMPVGAKFDVFIAPIFEDGFEMGSTVLWSTSVP